MHISADRRGYGTLGDRWSGPVQNGLIWRAAFSPTHRERPFMPMAAVARASAVLECFARPGVLGQELGGPVARALGGLRDLGFVSGPGLRVDGGFLARGLRGPSG